MAITEYVANVEEAIKLAEAWRKEGRYDWFRGQIQAWPPASTIERKIGADAGKQQEYQELIGRFLRWAKDRPDLAYLCDDKNMNALFAVLQHYGVPTCYIDFSKEPAIAGFFSADSIEPPKEQIESAIYCLNTEDLTRFYEEYTRKIPEYENLELEMVSVDVSNLWRLQAQSGHFVYANHPWYRIYDMDKIVFPWTGYPAYPSKEEIYPMHKSALEQSLDEFFFLERRRTGHLFFKQIAESASGANIASYRLESMENFYDREAFDQPLSIHPSWNKAFNSGWRDVKTEQFSQISGKACRLQIRENAGAADLKTQIRSGMEFAMRNSSLRDFAVDWTFNGLPAYANTERFVRMVRELWNGMRNLPYTDIDICEAVAQLAHLTISEDKDSYSRACDYSEDAIQVEFCRYDSASARAFCSAMVLTACMVPEVRTATVEPYEDASCEEMLLICHNPQILFDFEKFKHVFATHIIPSQLAIERPLVIFNPAHLMTFGLP